MKLIKNIYNTSANGTGILEVASEKLLEVVEEMLDEQLDSFKRGREGRIEADTIEENMELAKIKLKALKQEEKLDEKLVEIEERKAKLAAVRLARNQPQS